MGRRRPSPAFWLEPARSRAPQRRPRGPRCPSEPPGAWVVPLRSSSLSPPECGVFAVFGPTLTQRGGGRNHNVRTYLTGAATREHRQAVLGLGGGSTEKVRIID